MNWYRTWMMAFGALVAASAWAAPLSACRVAGIEAQVMCGSIQRPLDESKPQGKQVEVRFVVLPAISRNKLPDPVLLFAGGPGQSGIKLAGQAEALFGRLRNRRDVVVFDQRGVGQSMGLECPVDRRMPLAQAIDGSRLGEQMQRCKAQIKTKHGLSEEQLIHFTTAESSRDVEAIRQQLGAEQLNIVGGSYGTRAALDYARQFPQRVRRMVLDGVAPPDMVLPDSGEQDVQAAWAQVVAACEAQASCNRRFPKLPAALATALERLPQDVALVHPITLQRERLRVERDTVLNAIRTPLYAPAFAQALPFAVTQAAAGDYAPLLNLPSGLAGGGTEMAWGMHFSVVCAEDFPRMTSTPNPAAGVFAGSFSQLYRTVCKDWPQAPVPAVFYTVPPANFPSLVLSGTADPVTPTRHGQRVSQALGAQARHVVVPQAGHGVMAVGCARELITRFIQAATPDDALAANAQCLGAIPRPPAYIPPQAQSAPGAAP